MTSYGPKDMADSFRTVRKNTILVAQDIPEDKYDYRAAEGVMTVAEMLAGGGIDMPPSRDLRTFKKAPRAKGKGKAERPDYSTLPFMGLRDDPTSAPSTGETGSNS